LLVGSWEARFPRETRFLREATDDSPKKPKIVGIGAYAGENQKGELLMNIRILLLLPLLLGLSVNGWAAPGECSGPKKDRPDECNGEDETAVYTAELTMGGFIFGPVDVTPSKRGNSYHSEETLKMSRSLVSTDDQMEWDVVFGECADLLTTLPIDSVAVADNWTIDNSGGNEAGTVGSNIRIRFKDVEAEGSPDVDINFDLIGVLVNTTDDPFLPVKKDDTSSFTLTQFVIFGDKKKGRSCRSGVQDLQVYSVLEITRTK